jgi:hypothetical protein
LVRVFIAMQGTREGDSKRFCLRFAIQEASGCDEPPGSSPV